MDLFEHKNQDANSGNIPLAERVRPRRLREVVGQQHLLAEGSLLRTSIEKDRLSSAIFWGPPGTGKTTLAAVVAEETSCHFIPFSAVLGGVPELRKHLEKAKEKKNYYGEQTILFIDEIHRFNKAQQDALLPHVERGTVTLIGATTENPSFAVNAALLSRARVFRLEPLSDDDVCLLLERAVDVGFDDKPHFDEDALAALASAAHGDARRALGALQSAVDQAEGRIITPKLVAAIFQSKTLLFDKSGEEHYNVTSAFIKSMRGSDPDAAIYWMMRLLEAGDDPRFVARRMIIFASEDIGNADPRALELAIAADRGHERLGMPEALHCLSQCCLYLASAPKSNASYRAFRGAQNDIAEHGALPVPMKLRNAATKPMKAWGYGQGYRYPHDEGGVAEGETYLPERLGSRRYYEPTNQGFEARIAERLRTLRKPGED